MGLEGWEHGQCRGVASPLLGPLALLKTSPLAPSTPSGRGGLWSRAPQASLPYRLLGASLLPPSQPECSSSIVPHCGTAPPPPHSSPVQPLQQFPKPAIPLFHSPLGSRRRKGPPRSCLLRLDPPQHPHPPTYPANQPRDAGDERVWYQILGWIHSTFCTPPPPGTQPDIHSGHRISRCRFLTRPAPAGPLSSSPLSPRSHIPF